MSAWCFAVPGHGTYQRGCDHGASSSTARSDPKVDAGCAVWSPIGLHCQALQGLSLGSRASGGRAGSRLRPTRPPGRLSRANSRRCLSRLETRRTSYLYRFGHEPVLRPKDGRPEAPGCRARGSETGRPARVAPRSGGCHLADLGTWVLSLPPAPRARARFEFMGEPLRRLGGYEMVNQESPAALHEPTGATGRSVWTACVVVARRRCRTRPIMRYGPRRSRS